MEPCRGSARASDLPVALLSRQTDRQNSPARGCPWPQSQGKGSPALFAVGQHFTVACPLEGGQGLESSPGPPRHAQRSRSSLQIVLHREQEVLDCECDMASVHHLLSQIPQDLPYETLISKAGDLFVQFPPSKLAREAAQQQVER